MGEAGIKLKLSETVTCSCEGLMIGGMMETEDALFYNKQCKYMYTCASVLLHEHRNLCARLNVEDML